MRTAQVGRTEPPQVTGEAAPRGAGREQSVELDLMPAQKVGAETETSEESEPANRTESETTDKKNTTIGLPQVAVIDARYVDAGLPAKLRPGAPMARDGNAVTAKGKHGASAPVAEAPESVKAMPEAQAEAAGSITVAPITVVSTAAAPMAAVPEGTATVLHQAAAAAGPAVNEKDPPAGSSRATVGQAGKALPAAAVPDSGMRHENTATHFSAPSRGANSELNMAATSGATGTGVASVAVGVTSSESESKPAKIHSAATTQTEARGVGSGDAPQVLASGPARLDVGVLDGTHGWLRIRAEMGAGGAVSAALTANAVAHESLRAVLPEMASYLESESVSVSRIALHRAAGANGMAATGDQQSGGAQRHDGTGEQTESGAGPTKRSLHGMDQIVSGSKSPAASDAADAWNGGARALAGLELGIAGNSSGCWLNVCA
jgi:hypothetical protein